MAPQPHQDDPQNINDKPKGVDIKLSSVMDYIRGEEVDEKVLKQYSNLLRNFKPNFIGFLAMTAYKQMSRLSRLLDQLETIEERLYMDQDQIVNGGGGVASGSYDDPIGETEDGEVVQGVSDSSEERLLAMSGRITNQVQSTLGFLMTLLDRIEQKNMPDKIDMIQQNKALPESSKINASKLDANGRKRVRQLIKHLEDALPADVVG